MAVRATTPLQAGRSFRFFVVTTRIAVFKVRLDQKGITSMNTISKFLVTKIVCIFVALLLVMPVPAAAQSLMPPTSAETAEGITLPDPLTAEAVRELVSRLSDQEVRVLLLDRLDAVAMEAANQPPEKSGLALVGPTLRDIGETVGESISRGGDVWAGVKRGFFRFLEPRGWSGFWKLLGLTALAVLIGFIAEFIMNRALRAWRGQIATLQANTLGQTLRLLIKRAFYDTIGLLTFYVVTFFALRTFLSGEAPASDGTVRHYSDALIATTFVGSLILFPRVLLAASRFLSAPFQPELRLIHTDDWTARFLYRQQIIVFTIWGMMGFLIPFLASHGISMGQLRLGFWFNATAYLILLYSTWRARPGLTMMLMGKDNDVTPTEAKFARAYPYLCMAVIILSWLLIQLIVAKEQFQLLDGRQVWSLLLLLFAPTFDTGVRGLVKHLVKPMTGEGRLAEDAYHRTKRSYIRIGRVIISVGIILLLAKLWDIDLSNLAASSVGARAAGVIIEGIIIVLSGYLFWEIVSLWINRKLAAEQTAMGEDGDAGDEGGTGVSRLATILPLLLGALKVAIMVIVALLVIGNFGIDITPLLAGAGIVGLAIGFGAQKLVADVVSGIFFLIDDAFRAGEYLDVEGTLGTVEKISIRSMQLRHHKGAVHTIPYGEIPKITNYSRDWVIVKLKFTVPFDTNPNQVKKLFKKIGAEMMDVPEFAEDFLQPFKSQGVFDFDDVGMIIRGKFMAKPGKQFVLRKEIYNRVKAAFEANGISFARREVRVAIPGLDNRDDLSDEQKSAISAGAAQAAESTPKP